MAVKSAPDAAVAGGAQNAPEIAAALPKPLKKLTAPSKSAGAQQPAEPKPDGRKPKGDPLPDLVLTNDLADLLGVTPVYVRRISDAGFFPKAERNKFNLRQAVRGYIAHLKDDDRRSTKSASASRVHDARAEEIQLRTDERRKRLLAEAQAEALGIIDEYFGGLRADLNSLPARTTTDLAMRRKLQNGIDAAFAAANKKAIAAAVLAPESGPALRAAGHASPRRMGKRKPRVSAKSRRPRKARPKPDAVHHPV